MTSSVTAPLERQFGQMPSLNQMSSPSSAGASVITLQFGLELSLDVAEQEVQAAINAAGNLLPADLPAPPIYAKVNPADAPILTLAVTSKTLPLTEVQDMADTRLAQKISQLPGVGPGQHQRRPAAGRAHPGQSARARRLRAQYRRPAHHDRQRSTSTRRRAISTARRAPTRSTPTTSCTDAARLSATPIVAYRNGAPVRLSDVATVVEGAENDQARRLDEHDAGGDRQRPAPARRQRHRSRRHASRRCCRSCRRRCRPRST